MKKLLVILTTLAAVILPSCTSIQTKPDCYVYQYGVIIVSNRTDEYKTVRMFRVIMGDDGKYQTVGPPADRILEPMVEGRVQVSPGMVLVMIHPVRGKTWMKVFIVEMCNAPIHIDIKAPVVLKDLPMKLRSRRGTQTACPPCPCSRRRDE